MKDTSSWLLLLFCSSFFFVVVALFLLYFLILASVAIFYFSFLSFLKCVPCQCHQCRRAGRCRGCRGGSRTCPSGLWRYFRTCSGLVGGKERKVSSCSVCRCGKEERKVSSCSWLVGEKKKKKKVRELVQAEGTRLKLTKTKVDAQASVASL